MTTLLERLCGWAAALTLDQVPARVVALARSQVLSHLAAIRAGLAHPGGRPLLALYGPPLQPDPARSAAVLAGLGSWLHFDDTAYAGHLSNSTVAVPLGYGYHLGLSGAELLTAVIAANECAARITAAATLGPFRGQLAAHTNLAGAVAGRLRCQGAPAARWVDAFGLALAMPGWHLTHAFLGSDARRLGSAGPVRAGLDACDAAAAGLRGAPDILEHPKGFLARFATVPLPEAVSAGLGTRWHTDTLSFKMHPSGPGTDAAVDCALGLHAELGPLAAGEVAEVLVHTSLYTLMVDRAAAGYLGGPDLPLSALVSTTPYAVATALLSGSLRPEDFTGPAAGCPRRRALAGRVRLLHEEAMTAALLHSTAPFGEAIRQAGDRAAGWLREFGGERLVGLLGTPGPPATTFARATKATPARVEVRLAGGAVHRRQFDIPVGAAGPDTRRRHGALVRAKFLGTGGRPDVADAAARLEELPAAQVRHLLTAALS
jgi:2-methylcitrate dehydratase PrpD